MNRVFTQREKVLLLILTAILLVLGYTRLFRAPIQAQIAADQSRLADAQSALTVENARYEKMKSMEDEIAALKESGAVPNAEIPAYDNVRSVMVQLNAILARAKEYNLTFEEVVPGSDGILSRPIRMDFTAGDYQTVRAIVDDLYHCWYRCSIEDLTVTAEKNLNTPGSVTAQLSVIFYEKMPTDE